MLKKHTLIIFIASIIVCTAIIVVAASQISDNNTEEAEIIKNTYTDVTEKDWFYNDIQKISNSGLMKGTSEDTFSPILSTNRAMIATILWRLEGMPIDGDNSFDDVGKKDYFYNAVTWASKNKIVKGYNENTFAPDDFATREQLMTIMYRYASYKKYDLKSDVTLEKYDDKDTISDYAVEAVKWCLANGIVTGTSYTTLSPGEYVQRCQVAAILNRFCSQYLKTTKAEEDIKVSGDTKINPTNSSASVNSSKTTENEKNDNLNNDIENNEESKPLTSDKTNTDYPLLKIESKSALPGDNIQIQVLLNNNPGILGIMFSVLYDETCMELLNADNGNVFSDAWSFTTSKELKSGTNFLWDGVDISDEDVRDGTVLTMTFKILNDAVGGKHPIMIKYSSGNIFDNNLNGVSPLIENGYITITSR